MTKAARLTPEDPLQGAAMAGRWTFGYDMPDELGGGFVCGELPLRSDGILLRRYGGSTYRTGQFTWNFQPWEQVTWWTGETNPQQAIAILKCRGYDLCEPDPIPIDESTYGPVPGEPNAGKHL